MVISGETLNSNSFESIISGLFSLAQPIKGESESITDKLKISPLQIVSFLDTSKHVISFTKTSST